MKKAGCCTFCDVEVYEVKTRWTVPALFGEPRQLGAPTENAVWGTYALSDGSRMVLTFCQKCIGRASDPAEFPALWRIVLTAFERELSPEYIAVIGNPPRSAEQQKHVDAFVAELANKSIIGFLAEKKPTDTLDA